jgi:hemerythrin-like domain-containing protein
MMKEHEFGRSCLAGILDAARDGEAGAVDEIRAYATDYVGMLRQHITKEDTVLFRSARYVLE